MGSERRSVRWLAWLTGIAATALLGACQPATPADPLEEQAREYVDLALALDRIRPGTVDAYFGPAERDRRADGNGPPIQEISSRATSLLAAVSANAESPRSQRLQARVSQLVALLEVMSADKPLLFADEARKLYGIELPVADTEGPKRFLDELDALLPGPGTLPLRVASFQNRLVIPADKRAAVFEAAVTECRRRTLAHWTLPNTEQLDVEFTRAVPSAWHRYEGQGRSSLQVNPLAVAFIGTALDVACHEGYPGHHAQFLVMESVAGPQGLPLHDRVEVGSRGLPIENTVVVLKSPGSVLREGAANYGVQLVFTSEERLAFERDILFPIAGLPPAEAGKAAVVHRLTGELAASVIPILKDYRDTTISFNTATFRLEREALITSPAALLKFVDENGAYVVGYTIARGKVQDYVEQQSQQSDEDRWTVLRRVFEQPEAAVLSAPAIAPAVVTHSRPPADHRVDGDPPPGFRDFGV